MKFQFIAEHHQQYPITLRCRVLEVTARGYYAWQKRTASRRAQTDQALGQHIERIFIAKRARLWQPSDSCGAALTGVQMWS